MARAPCKRLLLVTEPDGSFGAGAKTWTVPDLDRIRAILSEAGIPNQAVRIDALLDFAVRDGDLAVYTSAYGEGLRQYVRDVLHFARQRIPVTPEYDLLLAHENKGFQELLKSERAFGNLAGSYHVDFDDRGVEPPYVFKTAGGAGSTGVALVRSAADEAAIRRRYFGVDLVRRLKLMQRRSALRVAGQFRRYAYYYKRFRPYVVQPFVEGLAGDFKVLAFGERYYTLARRNRPNDFRASGSGDFDFEALCPDRVLDFAREVRDRFDTPFLSLDVADQGGTCRLLEFQALNFGPLTVTGSNGYYRAAGSGWERVTAPGDLEDAFAHAIIHYLAAPAAS